MTDQTTVLVLSDRQVRMLALYAVGKTRSQIASELYISESRVRDGLKDVQERLEAKSLRQMVVKAIALGLIRPWPDGTVTVLQSI